MQTKVGISIGRFLFLQNSKPTKEKIYEADLNSLQMHVLKFDKCRNLSYQQIHLKYIEHA